MGDVEFGYANGKSILKEFNLHLWPGETVAIYTDDAFESRINEFNDLLNALGKRPNFTVVDLFGLSRAELPHHPVALAVHAQPAHRDVALLQRGLVELPGAALLDRGVEGQGRRHRDALVPLRDHLIHGMI